MLSSKMEFEKGRLGKIARLYKEVPQLSGNIESDIEILTSHVVYADSQK